MSNVYDVGDTAKLAGTFTNPDNNNALFDPSVVKLSVKTPSGTVTTYTYNTDVLLVRDSIGSYSYLLELDTAGTYYYRWWSTGPKTAEWSRFRVRANPVV